MKNTLSLLTACALAGLASAAITAVSISASAETADVAAPSSELTAQVRQILLDNPEMIVEALNRYEEKQKEVAEASQREAIAAHLDEVWDLPGLHVAGNPKGSVRVVEFFDYRCGFCKRAMPAILDLLKEEKDLAIAFVEFPILSPASLLASKAAVAAGKQDRYFEMHRALMTTKGNIDEDRIMSIAAKLKLDTDRLARDMESEETERVLDAHRRLATLLQVDGTPTFIVGDQPVSGWREDILRSLIKAESTKKG